MEQDLSENNAVWCGGRVGLTSDEQSPFYDPLGREAEGTRAGGVGHKENSSFLHLAPIAFLPSNGVHPRGLWRWTL